MLTNGRCLTMRKIHFCCRLKEKKEGESRQNFSLKYNLNINGAKQRVCKYFFVNTTGPKNTKVYHVVSDQKQKSDEGRHST